MFSHWKSEVLYYVQNPDVALANFTFAQWKNCILIITMWMEILVYWRMGLSFITESKRFGSEH
jgi:hypothetical protein